MRWDVTITFTKDDNKGVLFLHNDTVVVTLNMENYNICHILVDNRSSAVVLYFDALTKMAISPD